ncbi:helix-turn-helix domain-containing protein [Nonomuraea sp. NPDC050383]|uniref:helix-turn-helix domain-containing protein n=1 Tax=Nonomuraea sp. NPDC050383 TaxID=3364362 RepID=UPI0037B2F697
MDVACLIRWWLAAKGTCDRPSCPDERKARQKFVHSISGSACRLREGRGWTQDHLAREAGMTQSAVARLEAGGTIPTLPVLERLARALDADVEARSTPRVPAVRRTETTSAQRRRLPGDGRRRPPRHPVTPLTPWTRGGQGFLREHSGVFLNATRRRRAA